MKKINSNYPPMPNVSPSHLRGGSSPQEDLDSELLVRAGCLIEGLNLCVKPEAPLIWCLHIVVDHHMHAHLQLVPPQQGPGTWPHIHWSHLHNPILWVAGEEKK